MPNSSLRKALSTSAVGSLKGLVDVRIKVPTTILAGAAAAPTAPNQNLEGEVKPLVRAAESLAIRDARPFPHAYVRNLVYVPVFLTTATIKVLRYNAIEGVDVKTGLLDTTAAEELGNETVVRLTKPLSSERDHRFAERTVLVVNASYLSDFLDEICVNSIDYGGSERTLREDT